jgi:hypothetical protein
MDPLHVRDTPLTLPALMAVKHLGTAHSAPHGQKRQKRGRESFLDLSRRLR